MMICLGPPALGHARQQQGLDSSAARLPKLSSLLSMPKSSFRTALLQTAEHHYEGNRTSKLPQLHHCTTEGPQPGGPGGGLAGGLWGSFWCWSGRVAVSVNTKEKEQLMCGACSSVSSW